jgi:hypothetical protein
LCSSLQNLRDSVGGWIFLSIFVFKVVQIF